MYVWISNLESHSNVLYSWYTSILLLKRMGLSTDFS
jgi:hypothetical protein